MQTYTTKQKIGLAIITAFCIASFLLVAHFDYLSLMNGTLH